MLGDILVSRAAIGQRPIDLHRHASFRCEMKRLFRRVARLFQ